MAAPVPEYQKYLRVAGQVQYGTELSAIEVVRILAEEIERTLYNEVPSLDEVFAPRSAECVDSDLWIEIPSPDLGCARNRP